MIIEDGGDDEKDKKAILDDETKINEPLFLTGSREYSDCNISDSTSSSKQGIGTQISNAICFICLFS